MDKPQIYRGYANPELDVSLVTGFCDAHKDIGTLREADAWAIFTGTGYRLPEYVLGRRRVADSHQPILIIGPDNLLLAKNGKETTAAHFKQWFVDQGVKEAEISAIDDIGMYTPSQAKELLKIARSNGLGKIVLFTPWFHMLRAWLTVLGQMAILGYNPAEFQIIPEPADTLFFQEPNLELTDRKSAWFLRWLDELPRIQKYQTEKDPPDVAKWSTAVDYLLLHSWIA